MRIGIDARFYGVIGKGLGRYASELIAALERADQTNEYVIFLRKENFDDYAPKNPRFTKALADFPWYGVAEQLRFPALLDRHRLDLAHFPHFNVPILYRKPFVVTVHDLILLSHPSARATTLGPVAFAVKFFFYRRIIASALRRARRVLTVSDYTKNEILRHFPSVRQDKIDVTRIAAGSVPVSPDKQRPASPPFALYVGNAYPHKNLDRLFRAFRLMRMQRPEFTLTLVGDRDYFSSRLEADAQRGGYADNVRFFGRATEQELTKLYATASLYVFPSLCEGFGIPPLEAMAAGVPVASSNATAMPEILGDAALFFDPTDERAMADAMLRLASDESLRIELARRGSEQTKRYSWDACASQTLAAYASALRQ